jgi:hypothetical protein
MNLSLHIERLVLHGLPLSSADSVLLQAAVEAELALLLGKPLTLPATPGAEARLTGTAISLRPETPVPELGKRIANSIFASLCPAGVGNQPKLNLSSR